MEENQPNSQGDQQIRAQNLLPALILAVAWIVTFAVTLAGYVPLLLTALLIVFVIVAPIGVFLHSGARFSLKPARDLLVGADRALSLSLLAFAAYIALASLWSSDSRTALAKALLILCIVLAGNLGFYLAGLSDRAQTMRFARGVMIGTMIALVFPLFELASGLSILNFLAGHFPHIIKTGITSDHVPKWYLNRNVTVLSLFFWPTLLTAWFWRGFPDRRYLIALLVVLLLPTVFISQSETAKVAIIAGGITFFASRAFPRPVHITAMVLWVIAIVATIPLITGLYKTGVQDANWLNFSARDRIHIWHYTAERVFENPLMGIGVRSSRTYKRNPVPALRVKRPVTLKDHPGWHSHNIYLQTWYELGGIGATFLLFIGLYMLRAIERLPQPVRPFAHAGFAGFATIGAFGYGIWQSWLLASFGWTVILFLFTVRYATDSPSREPPPDREARV